ncbi:MAG: ribosome recycling factor [Patescibacteria group bacterium]|nr:ribosome recycling factor [Patescibacteria group bacterium]
MPSDIISAHQQEFQDAIDFLKLELGGLRTGRATPALVENIMVEAYGSRTQIKGLASISTPDSRTINIDPWDKNVVKDIERAIADANVGLTPNVQGKLIRISLQPLTEESRRDLIKIMGEKLEQARIGVRGVREAAKSEIVEAEKSKEIGEDEKYRLLEALDKTAAGWNEKIKEMGEEKEKEIMTI